RVRIRRNSQGDIFSSSLLHACQGRLAVTAAGARFQDSGPDDDVDRLCQMAAEGRRAVRALAHWSSLLEVSEAELQILWGLRAGRGQGVDQTALAMRLTLSPALVSSCVEKLRQRGLIAHQQ